MNQHLMRIEEVALRIGVSTKTIRNWYKFKRENPDDELAKILPDPVTFGSGPALHWTSNDIWRLLEFKAKIPRGRNGVMGTVTQKYVK